MQAGFGGTEPTRRGDGRSVGGAILSCLLMAACGGLLVLAMHRLPQQQAGVVPTEAASNVPPQKLRFVTCDVGRRHLQDEPLITQIRHLNADYLILQNTSGADANTLADLLKMHCAFLMSSPSLPSAGGNCILSRLPLSIAQSAADIGVWTSSEAAGKSFFICSISAAQSAGSSAFERLVADWQSRGSPPVVLAGKFPSEDADISPVQLHSGWFDGLSAWERLLPNSPAVERSTRIFLSPGWSCSAGGTVASNALSLSWIDASASATATAPTTQAATQPSDD